MSRAGTITVDGNLVGVVIQIDDDTGSPQSSSPVGLQQASFESYSEPRYRNDDAIGHSSQGRSGGGYHESGIHHEEGRATTGPVSIGKGDDPRGMESHIRSEAAKNNVDPDTAVKVAKSEGLRDFSGDRGTSFGAFQLHKHGGLGDEFQKQTGLDPADPANEKAGISWALQNVGRTGWGPYHGAARVGVGKWDGIGGNKPSGTAAAPAVTPTASKDLKGDDVKGFIVHHTGGRGTPEGVQNTLRQRGLGVEYIMDRDGNITQAGNRGAAQMMTGWGKGEGLNNRNTVGMEVIAKDNRDVTPAQIAAGKAFIDKNYPNTPVYGHGEVNPGHKEADEGMGIVNAVRGGRQNTQASNSKPFDPGTMAP